MNQKIKIGISSCLLGNKVRYDGQHKLDNFLKNTLGQFVEWLPICPEVECGLSIPREAMNLHGTLENPQLYTIRTKKNLTEKMQNWISVKISELAKENLSGFIFKKKSPSSGLYDAKLYNEKGFSYAKTPGLFAKAFIENFPLIPVEDEGRLHDPVLRENFIERCFIFYRWQEMVSSNFSKHSLSDFHKKHKLIVMSHSPSSTAVLGRIASKSEINQSDLNDYITLLMEILKKKATVKKHVNVLHHIMGYFKKDLSSWEKQELIEIIESYHNVLIPLIVPLTILQHYIKKYNKEYLMEQYYIYQHPAELKLRNHV